MSDLYEYYHPAGVLGKFFGLTTWVTQTFTPQISHSITEVHLKLCRQNSSYDPRTITVSIKEVDENNHPTGDDLEGATGTINGTNLANYPNFSEETFTLSTPVSVVADIMYAIVIRATEADNVASAELLNVTSGGTYTLGREWVSTNSGSTWVSSGTYADAWFEEWGDLSPPEKPINPTPEHEGSGVGLNDTTASWEDGGGATSYNIYYGTLSGFLSLVAEGVTDLEQVLLPTPFSHYGEIYYWRVDAVNEVGTTEGDEWSFTTLIFDPVLPTGITFVDGEPTGTPTGENNMITVKRLVAAANSKIWYEDI